MLFQWLSLLKFLRAKLQMDVDSEGRAPLASEETMESPVQLCGEISEFSRGKEFKVSNSVQ